MKPCSKCKRHPKQRNHAWCRQCANAYMREHRSDKPQRERYKVIRVGKRIMREHRYVMEQSLGRRLRRTECVVHKDRNPLNNALSNLMVVSSRELHTGKRFYDVRRVK